MTDAWRLTVGTLTVVPVPTPTTLNRRTARGAMLLAPVIGALIGLVAFGWAVVVGWFFSGSGGQLVVAATSIGLIALLTRAIHLDGLADVADGLGSGKTGEAAVAVMRRSDIGPMGVAVLTLTLVVQTAALSAALATGRGALALVGGCMVSRLAITWSCRTSVPAAARTGLGAAVSGSVPVGGLVSATAAVAGVLAVAVVVAGDPWTAAYQAVGALVAALAGAELLVRRCIHRFGGVTGDVLGAGCEVALSVFLVVVAAT